MNGLALAYIGDAVYEVYIRDYLIEQGQTRPNQLHHMATHYAQAALIQKMLDEEIMTEEEYDFYRRGRNSKSHTSAKNADVTTYRIATGFESLIGYLHLTKQQDRLDTLVAWCIKKVGEEDEGKETKKTVASKHGKK